MRITNYSLLNFAVSFTIPVSKQISYITIVDNLVNGLSYTPSTSTIEFNGVPQLTGISDNSTSTKINLKIDNTTPTISTAVKIIIPVMVSDIDALIQVISDAQNASKTPQDITIITAYDSSNTPLGILDVPVALDFQKFIPYMYLTPLTIEKKPYLPLYTNIMLPGVGSLGNNKLNHNVYIDFYGIVIAPVIPLDVSIYVGDLGENKLSPSDFSLDILRFGRVRIVIPHTTLMRNQPIYICVKCVTPIYIESVTSEIIYINTAYVLEYDYNSICSTTTLNIPINLIDASPELFK
ncbi:MAG: hypothetical protein ACRC2K_08385 [Clostridium sp.]